MHRRAEQSGNVGSNQRPRSLPPSINEVLENHLGA